MTLSELLLSGAALAGPVLTYIVASRKSKADLAEVAMDIAREMLEEQRHERDELKEEVRQLRETVEELSQHIETLESAIEKAGLPIPPRPRKRATSHG